MGFLANRRRRLVQQTIEQFQEATDQQLVATGAIAAYGGYGVDPIDGDRGFVPLGQSPREMPWFTLERARASSVAGYRANPMARAIIDTYTSFCVGDSGLTLQCTNDEVRVVADEFWNDPANCMHEQDIMLRSHLLNGETAYEMMTGEWTGIVRRSVIDPLIITGVNLFRGNPLWPSEIVIRNAGAEPDTKAVIRIDDITGLRSGEVMFWRSFRALETDRRGTPFLTPVLDWLDNYDQVMSNLIDRTAVARYIALHYQLGGTAPDGNPWTQESIDDYVKRRGGNHMPRSGSSEFTTADVKIEPINVQSGSFEDTNTAEGVLTSVAAGTGLSKHWVAEPGDVNRATSLSMAEPVRRRVGGVQRLWLDYQTELVRFAVDRAVAAGRIPSMVPATAADGSTGSGVEVPAAQTVRITGPEVAAADSNIVATVLANLSTALDKLVARNVLSVDAARVAAQKAWEEFTGVPFTADLAAKGDANDIVDHVEDNAATVKSSPLGSVLTV